ncbi:MULTISPECIES: hypothetical protein [Amycolatopsis]|uniref:hypothetical protein n=1 Tax=Amycolatopsis TaxID=1813 RepID=UPI001161358D|nr:MULTISPECIES: hypothetical protein [Amycolatopsis]
MGIGTARAASNVGPLLDDRSHTHRPGTIAFLDDPSRALSTGRSPRRLPSRSTQEPEPIGREAGHGKYGLSLP